MTDTDLKKESQLSRAEDWLNDAFDPGTEQEKEEPKESEKEEDSGDK
jgi:hypothetical protein